MYSPQKSAGRAPDRPGRRSPYLGAAAVVLTLGLAGCASAATAGPGAAGTSPTGTPSASGSASGSATPGSGVGTPTDGSSTGTVNLGGPLASPQSQTSTVPAGTQLTAFEGVSRSSDGRTLYIAATAGGGACGEYDVVVQETSTTVSLGLAHVIPAKAVPCPMFVRLADFPAQLSSPLGGRQVIDLANGQSAGSGGSIPIIGSEHPGLPQG